MPIRQCAVLAVLVFFSIPTLALPQDPVQLMLNPGLSSVQKVNEACPTEGPDKDPEYEAIGLPAFSGLTSRQQGLLGDYLSVVADTTYEKWVPSNNGRIAEFLALTRALSRTVIHLPGGDRSALDIVKGINEIQTTRVKARLDSAALQEWDRNGGHFTINLANGKTETGRVRFADHTVPLSGTLHCGYDIQGVTSTRKVPHIQWNYRYADAEADMDLDGFAAIVWGFIPNPKHLTHANSDVRHWLDKYVKKFGDPGFQVRKVR